MLSNAYRVGNFGTWQGAGDYIVGGEENRSLAARQSWNSADGFTAGRSDRGQHAVGVVRTGLESKR